MERGFAIRKHWGFGVFPDLSADTAADFEGLAWASARFFMLSFLWLLPDLSPPTSKIALRRGSKANATRHSPPAALHLNSFMLACRDPFNVST